MEHSLHKVTLEVSEKEWLRFKALCVESDKRIQRALGELVEREARGADRRQAARLGRTKAAKRAMEKSLAEIRRGGTTS